MINKIIIYFLIYYINDKILLNNIKIMENLLKIINRIK